MTTDWQNSHPRYWTEEQVEELLSIMDEPADQRKSWTQSVQSITPGVALDIAISILEKQLGQKVSPSESILSGPFTPQMRPDALNVINNSWGVWDITLRWY